jgi:hypothetical protein
MPLAACWSCQWKGTNICPSLWQYSTRWWRQVIKTQPCDWLFFFWRLILDRSWWIGSQCTYACSSYGQIEPRPCYSDTTHADLSSTISRYLLLKNMFNPDEEEGADWDQDIKSDILEECSKYGSIQHIFVEKYSQVSLPIISQEERGFIISIYTLPPMYVSSFHWMRSIY